MKSLRKSISVIIIFVIATSCAYAANIGNESISSQGAVVMDFDTGSILYSYNGDKAFVPASMTKVMSLYLIYEKIENGDINYNSVVPITKNAYNASRDSELMGNAMLNYNEKYTVDELLNAVWVNSLNAAIIALAEFTYGSEKNFVEKMNSKANEMGISAYYVSSHGLESQNKITPVSMAYLARKIINDFPIILNKTTLKSYNFHGYNLQCTNKLLTSIYYDGADGLKTGTTSAAGYCFCATAKKDGKRLIAVTMKSSSTSERFYDCKKMLDYGFDKIGYAYSSDIRVFIEKNEVPSFLYDGEKRIPLVICEDLSCYGFDVSYNHESRTLTVEKNEEKEVNPIPMDYYRQFKAGTKMYKIKSDSNIKVEVIKEGQNIKLSDIKDFNGYVGISADELAKIFGGRWVNETKSIEIY